MSPFDLQQVAQMDMMRGAGQGANIPQFPQGALSGFMQVGNQMRMEDAASRQKEADLLSLAQKMEMMDEYRRNAGWRDAERQAGIAGANAKTATVGRRSEADTGLAELKLSQDTALSPSTVQAGIAKNEAAMTDAQAGRLETLSDMLDTTFDPNSAGAVGEYSARLDELGVPKEHALRRLEKAPSPEAFKQGYTAMRSSLENSLKQRRALSKTGLEKGADFDRAVTTTGIETASREQIAAGNNAATIEASQNRKSNEQLKLEGDLVKLLQAARTETDPDKRRAILQEADLVTRTIQAIGAARAPVTPMIQAPGITYSLPENRAGGIPGLDLGGGASPSQAPASKITAPAGRVVIFKDGVPVGHIPEGQAQAAEKQGYQVQR